MPTNILNFVRSLGFSKGIGWVITDPQLRLARTKPRHCSVGEEKVYKKREDVDGVQRTAVVCPESSQRSSSLSPSLAKYQSLQRETQLRLRTRELWNKWEEEWRPESLTYQKIGEKMKIETCTFTTLTIKHGWEALTHLWHCEKAPWFPASSSLLTSPRKEKKRYFLDTKFLNQKLNKCKRNLQYSIILIMSNFFLEFNFQKNFISIKTESDKRKTDCIFYLENNSTLCSLWRFERQWNYKTTNRKHLC